MSEKSLDKNLFVEILEDSSLDLFKCTFRSSQKIRNTTIQMEKCIGQTSALVNVDIKCADIDDLVIWEGDIVVATVSELNQPEYKGLAIHGEQYRWPNGIVYYTAQDILKSKVLAAIDHWQTHTPIKFIPRSNETDYISFEKLNGCWSMVGRQSGKQTISIGIGCTLGATIHEIGHALGLFHEQSRADRNNFIQIVKENIDPTQLHNFEQHIQDAKDLGDYDFASIMHYPATAFSITGLPTILTKKGEPIGQRNGLSKGDLKAVRSIYPNLDWQPYLIFQA